MDPRKKETVLQMIQSLWGRHVSTLHDLSDGHFFIHAMNLLKSGFKKKLLLEHRVDRLESTRTFLQEIYGKERVEKYLNFDILLSENDSSSQTQEGIELELTKIALVLYGIGVLDKNRQIFTDSALNLPVQMHTDIMELIQSVVQAGSVALLLTSTIETVLKTSSEHPISPIPVQNQSPLSTSPSTPKTTRRVSFAPSGEKDPQCGASKTVLHNRSFSEVTSPLRDLSIHNVSSSSSPLVQFMQSPQVIQKATICQKDLEIRKLRKQLTDEQCLKDDLQETLWEHQSQNVQKDSEIARLQTRIKSLLAYQDAADELQELKIKYDDLEHESKKMHIKLKEFENFKERIKFLEKLTDSQQEELKMLSNEKKFFESERKKNVMNLKNIGHLESQVHYLELQLKELNNCKTAWEKEKDSLLENFQAAKDKNNLLRHELDELQAGQDDSVQGESMGVVLELQIQDVRRELEDANAERDALQSRLDDQLRDINEKDEEISRLKSVLQLKDANICILQNNLASEERQKSELQIQQKEEIAAMKKKEERLQNELKELENKAAVADAMCCDLRKQLAETLEQKSAFEFKIKEEIAAMKKKEERLQNELKELENKAAVADAMCCDLRKQLAETLEQKSAFEFKIKAESSSRVEEVKSILKEQNEKISKYEEQLQNLTSQLQDYQTQENCYSAQNKSLEAECNRYKHTCKTMQEEIKSLGEREKRILAECDVKILKAKDYCNESKRQLEMSNKQLEDVKKENKHLTEQLERNNKSIQKIKSTNESLNSAMQIERETNSRLKKRMESQDLKFEEMRQKLESAQMENKQHANEINRLKTALDYSDRKIREYKQILEHAGTIHLGDSTHFRKVMEQEDCNNFDDSISSVNSHRKLRSHTNLDDSLHVSSDESILTADQIMLRRETLACTSDLKNEPCTSNLPQSEDSLSLCSVSSAQSIKSRTDVPVGFLPSASSCADEPEDLADFEWNRLNELQRRNTLYLPHMKSAYPVELQTVRKRITDDSIRLSLMPNGRGKASPSGYNTRQNKSKSGSAKPFKSDVNNKMTVKRKALPKQSSDEKSFESPPKKVQTAQLIQRPGPPSPGKQPRKISGRMTLSHGRPNACHAPGRLPSRRSPQLSSQVSESPVSDENDRRQSVTFNIGFTPDKSKAPKIFLQKNYGSEQMNSGKTKQVEVTQANCDQQNKRKPLGERNNLEIRS